MAIDCGNGGNVGCCRGADQDRHALIMRRFTPKKNPGSFLPGLIGLTQKGVGLLALAKQVHQHLEHVDEVQIERERAVDGELQR
jgi:hypothetical protein